MHSDDIIRRSILSPVSFMHYSSLIVLSIINRPKPSLPPVVIELNLGAL